MTTELLALTLSGLLLAAQLILMAVLANLQIGSAYFLTPRDKPPPEPINPRILRLQRAYNNHLEALVLFTVAVAAVTLTGSANGITATCAMRYLAARVLFVPAYAYGWMPWRSVFFGIGFAASITMLLVALL
ncbi:MAPEG family protein [Roseicitreum antarcticum]|uniref:MAPEG family protein n=1 Tax=Roseicitreum antarcticum TaxID=564137 RepID=A0A1H2XEU2_9RHOB|nr:MAPEG family protein [Roseicitreum antarcticum]SDW91360.1 MAPEG family protein [Roseicitreum antarcticum]